MITKFLFRSAVAAASVLALSACGGGGGGGAAEGPAPVTNTPFTIQITVQDDTLSANSSSINFGPGSAFSTQVNVRVTEADGSPVIDGLAVTLSVDQGQRGALSTSEDLATQTNSLQLLTAGGNVTAVFHTESETGPVVITATALDADAGTFLPGDAPPGVNVTRSVTVNVDNAVSPQDRLTVVPLKTTLPANTFGVLPFIGSPYLTEVTLTFRDANGVLASPGGGEDAEFAVSVDPVTRGAFSTLDDPETDDVNEFFVLLGNGTARAAAGTATIFVHAFDEPGPVVVRVTAQDAETGQVFEREVTINIVEPASNGTPAEITSNFESGVMYIQGSGGRTSQQFELSVVDGANQPVADPTSNNNVLLELFTEGPNTGETFQATGLAGNQQEGTTISVATTAGITGASFISGTQPGFVRIRATADAADNNVENGVQGPVRTEFVVEISDGVPFAVTLADPTLAPFVPNATSSATRVLDIQPGDPLDLTPDSIYELRLNAIVTDRRGNPPAQPVTLAFGLIDAPVLGFPTFGRGVFDHSGSDGNPAENRQTFTAQSADFIRANGTGIGPGDTLVLFGKDAPGNEDLESARQIEEVVSDITVQVDEPFNRNDFTGMSVDNAGVIPWAVGRGFIGNIDTGVVTDENGVAATQLRYPISALGHAAIVYAQGTVGTLGGAGNFRTFADIASIGYPGIGDVILTASPSVMLVNTTRPITVCAFDSAGSPLQGQIIEFSFSDDIGLGTVDGIPRTGQVANPTGFDGCTIAQVSITGVPVGTPDFSLDFSLGTAVATVAITGSSFGILEIFPDTYIGNQLAAEFTLTYRDGTGMPVPNVEIVGTCDVEGGDDEQPPLVNLMIDGPTDANGETTATVQALFVDACEPATVECTFTTITGQPMVTGRILGRSLEVIFSGSPVCDDP